MPTWIPDLASVVDSLYCIVGALALAKVTQWWCPTLGFRTATKYLALTLVLFSIPLLTPQYQLPLDYIYRFDPWRDAVEPPPETTQNPILSDVALQMIPFRTLVRKDLLAARSPLWSHEMGTGQPLLGNAQSAPFAPLHLLSLPLPPLRAMTVVAAWQVFVSLLLMHLLVAQLGACGRAAALAAIAFGLSVFQIGWLYHPLSMVSIWLPGTLLALDRLRLGKSRAAAGLVLMLAAALSSGHPGMVTISALVVGFWWMFLVIKSSNRFGFILTTVVAALIALGLSAPSWLPLTETIPLSERAQLLSQSPDLIQPPDFEPSRFLTLVSPFAYGSPRDGNWSGPSNFLELSTGFCGLLTLCLAITGGILFRGAVLAWLTAGIVALLVAMGAPPFYHLVAELPGAAQLPLGRFRLIFVLAISIAAGLSADRLARDRRSRWVASLTLAIGLAALHFTIPPDESAWQLTWRVVAAMGLVSILGALWIDRLRPRMVEIAYGFVLLELLTFGLRFHPLAPGAYDLRPPTVVTRLRDLTQARDAPSRVSALDGRLLPYLGSTYGLWDPRGFDPMRPGLALQLLRARLDRPALVGMFLQRGPVDQGFLDFLGIRFLLTGPEADLGENWRERYREKRVVVWENESALRMFFVPDRVVPCGSDRAAIAFAQSNEDFQAKSCAEGIPTAEPQEGSVRIAAVTPNGFRLAVDAPRPLIVASSVTWMPGWSLKVDDRVSEVLVVNAAFLGAEVEPGSHDLLFEYTPWQWRVGWLCCLASLAVGLLLISRPSFR